MTSYNAVIKDLVEKITAEVLRGVEASSDKKIDPVLKKLEACLSKIATLDTWITEAESRISNSEDAAETHITKLSEVESRLKATLEKLNDLENRSRWCNIRIVGLPEGSEGANPVAIFRTWLPELLKVSFKGGSVKLDRCSHTLTSCPLPGQWPRAVIVKLHNFQDKQRQEFYPVKQQLKERGIAFAMLYPAVLRINHGGQEKFFKHPKDVATFLDKVPQHRGSPSMIPAD
eukprot:superscaffoldBa00003245_g16464